MSTVMTTTPTASEEHLHLHDSIPSFFGLVRGEFFKILRQWTTWIMLVLFLGVIILPYIIEFTVPNVKTNIQTDSLHFFYDILSVGLSIVRVFTGIFLLVITARIVGLEYQLGTIRVLLSRGVGRLQLLFAKLLTIAIIALILLVIGLVLAAALCIALAGNLLASNWAVETSLPSFAEIGALHRGANLAMPLRAGENVPSIMAGHISNRSPARRNGNRKMAGRDRRLKPTNPGPKIRKLPTRDLGAPA